MRHDGDVAASRRELTRDVALGAVIDHRDLEARLALLDVIGLLAADVRDRVDLAICLDALHQFRGRLALDDRAVHDAVLADDAGQLARVHSAYTGNSVLLEHIIQLALAAEVGRRIAQVAHHISAQMRTVAFEVLFHHAVIADEGKGLYDDLSEKAGVGQRLDIARHTGREHDLADRLFFRSDRNPGELFAVFENKTNFFHKTSLA